MFFAIKSCILDVSTVLQIAYQSFRSYFILINFLFIVIIRMSFDFQNWLKPAGVSLSRLDQVKPSVYNVGLTDFRELRATSLQGRVKRTESNTELSHDPDLSRNAW